MNASRTIVEHHRESPGRAVSSGDVTTFEIDRQLGQNISNVGRDQTFYYGGRNRSSRWGKLLAALGLLLSLVGLVLLAVFGVMTAHSVLHAMKNGGVQTPYTQYLSSAWPATVGLIVSGLVVNRVARILVGR
jgi:hypothetical protein